MWQNTASANVTESVSETGSLYCRLCYRRRYIRADVACTETKESRGTSERVVSRVLERTTTRLKELERASTKFIGSRNDPGRVKSNRMRVNTDHNRHFLRGQSMIE